MYLLRRLQSPVLPGAGTQTIRVASALLLSQARTRIENLDIGTPYNRLLTDSSRDVGHFPARFGYERKPLTL